MFNKNKKRFIEAPHVQYDSDASEYKQFKNKMVDFRWQRFTNRQDYKIFFNAFKNGTGVAAKDHSTNKYLIITDDKIILSNSNKGLPQLPKDWYKHIIVLDRF